MGVPMKTYENEIDVLAAPLAAQNKQYVKPKDGEVLPPMASFCNCELIVNEVGMSAVAFTKSLPEGIHWVEYDMDLSILTFVTWSGSIMELGMKVHPPFRKYLKMAEQIMMVQMSEDEKHIVTMYPADLVVRNIGI